MSEARVGEPSTRQKPRSLVTLQAGTIGPPLYCFHPFSGSAAVYGRLANEMGRGRIVHGVQAVGLVAAAELDRSVEDMACRYAGEILAEAPPAGRSLFVGYSMGGLLAMETARLLADRLPRRPIVSIIDCDPVYSPSASTDPWHILVHQVLNLDLPVSRIAALPREVALADIRAAASARGVLPARFGLDRLNRLLEVCTANERAAAGFRPRWYPGRVHLLVPDAASGALTGWRSVVESVAAHHVPGDHHSIVDFPACREVAQVLRHIAPAEHDEVDDGRADQ
jgi:thioesterase domain-containing protein